MINKPIQAGTDIGSVYQIAFDENPLGMVLSDSDGRIRQINAEFERMLGYSQAEISGRSWEDITHPADQSAHRANLASFKKDSLQHLSTRKRYVAKSGAEVWANVKITSIFAWRLRTGFVTMVEDITGQVRADTELAEKRRLLTQVLGSAPIVMLACDLSGMVTMCEGGALLGSGYGKNRLVGRSIWTVVEDQALVRECFDRAVAGKAGSVVARFSGRIYAYHYHPVFDDSGSVIGVTAVALDISDRETAVEQNRQLSHFIASLNHELRTPLNTIIGFNELLSTKKAGPLNEKQEHYVDYVDRGARLLLSLVNDVLDLSKVKAGQMTIEAEPIDAVGAVRNAVMQMGPLATSKALDLFVADPESAIPMVVDGRRLHQVLLNLLSNAIKFTPAGGTVTVAVSRDDTGWTRFAVTDTGCGIPSDLLEAIFDEYRQVAGGAVRSSEGTGLGLALSRHFAQIMGGTLTVDSTVGRGSRFTLSLPTVFVPPSSPLVRERATKLPPAVRAKAAGVAQLQPRDRRLGRDRRRNKPSPRDP